MKRSERLMRKSCDMALLSIAILFSTVAVVCVTPAVLMNEDAIYGGRLAVCIAVGVLTSFGLFTSFCMMIESIQLNGKARREKRWEDERAIRPRL